MNLDLKSSYLAGMNNARYMLRFGEVLSLPLIDDPDLFRAWLMGYTDFVHKFLTGIELFDWNNNNGRLRRDGHAACLKKGGVISKEIPAR